MCGFWVCERCGREIKVGEEFFELPIREGGDYDDCLYCRDCFKLVFVVPYYGDKSDSVIDGMSELD